MITYGLIIHSICLSFLPPKKGKLIASSSNQNNKVKLNCSHKLACPEPSLLMIVLFNKNNYNNNSTAEAWYRLVTVNGWVFGEGMLDR